MSSDQHSVNQSIAPVAPSRPGSRRFGGIVTSAIGRTWRITLLTLLLLYFALGVMFLVLRYVVLPNIGEYQPHIESFASKALGQPVTIGSIQSDWQGLNPRLVFENVMIRDSDGKQALHLPKVAAVVSWWSAAVANVRLHSLDIQSPDLDIVRDPSGQLHIAGIPIDLNRQGDGKSLDWLLTQHEIVIREGAIRWNDYQRNAPELVLSDVELVLRNERNRHQLAVKASPPSHIATPLDVRADFHNPAFASRFSDAKQWKGTLYADWGNTDLSAWKTYIDYPFEVMAGKGSVQTWLYFDRTQVTNFIADVSLTDLVMRMHKDLEVLDLAQVQGRILVQEANGTQARRGDEVFGQNGYTVALTELSLEARNGLRLPSTTVSQTYTPPKSREPERREVAATMLDVGALAKLAGYLPLSQSDRRFLADFAPRGQLRDFYARADGAYPHISAYRISGHFRDLALNAQAPRPARPKSGKQAAQLAVPGIPGFEKLSGYVDGNEKGGEIQLNSAGAIIHLPGYFTESAMPFEQLNLDAEWSWEDLNRFIFQIEEMAFVQEGTAGSLSGRHTITLDEEMGPGEVDLVAHLPSFDIKRLGRYLPSITPPGLKEWLSTSLVDGHLKDAKLVLKGNLADFPFNPKTPGGKPTGELSVTARIQDGALNYLPWGRSEDGKKPLWPLLEQVDGKLDINRTRLAIKADSAMTHQAALSDIEVGIPDLLSEDVTLKASGKASGKLQDLVRYTRDSPVAGWIGKFTDDARASGDATLDLALTLPIFHMEKTEVRGTVDFVQNEIRLFDSLPPLQATNGRLTFNEKGFGLEDVRAQFAGGRVHVNGGTRADGTVEVRAQGGLSTRALTTVFPGEATQNLLQHIGGGTRYSAVIRVKDGHPEVIVDSNLRGIGLDLPDPLRKRPGEAMPMRAEWRMLDAKRSGMLQDELKIALGKVFDAHYTREKSEDKEAYWKVVRGGIGINMPAQQPDVGLFAYLDLPVLDLDAWRSMVQSITGEPQANEPKAPVQPGYGGLSQYIEPDTVAARAEQLVILGKKLDQVVVGASRISHVWQANIDSAQASGYVTWNTGDFQESSGKVVARLTSLVIPENATTDVTELLEGKDTTTELPALDILADNFEFGGIKLGSLNLIANNSHGAGGREWHIDKLVISNADAVFNAQGKWTAQNQKNVSSLSYSLDIEDAGKLLSRLGFEGVLRRGKGSVTGKLQWNDLPFALHKASLEGALKLELSNGQFIKVEPGAAKLLGVLSLQSLPRRLALDFRDIFSEGLAFDSIAGTADIARGVMSTDNLKMRSVNAAVLLDGKADITQETQDLRVVVVPEINAGGASVVYALVANPVVGLGSFLAQLFLRDPLRRAFTVEYDINGPWHDPVVRKVERKSGSPSATSSDNPRPMELHDSSEY
jgi:uncharacterized protein (TIGR02099 family)